MFCGKCGKQIEDDAKVCKWCGQPVEGACPPPEQTQENAVHQNPPHQERRYQTPPHQETPRQTPPVQMASLGISVGLMALCIYFSGLVSGTLLFLAAGYVLLKEKDRWLRAVAVKAVLIVCIFGAVGAGITALENGVYGLNALVSFISSGSMDYMAMQNLCNFLNYVCLILRDVILLVAGIQAFHCNNFRIGFIDRIVNRNIQK